MHLAVKENIRLKKPALYIKKNSKKLGMDLLIF
jgi:hypothetical protein